MQLAVLKILVQHGADKKVVDINGKKASDLAVALNNKDAIMFLVDEKDSKCA